MADAIAYDTVESRPLSDLRRAELHANFDQVGHDAHSGTQIRCAVADAQYALRPAWHLEADTLRLFMDRALQVAGAPSPCPRPRSPAQPLRHLLACCL